MKEGTYSSGCLFTAIGERYKEQILHVKELCKHIEIGMSDESGFREKKLLSCTDLAVVEVSKVVNKLLTETGFSFILPI